MPNERSARLLVPARRGIYVPRRGIGMADVPHPPVHPAFRRYALALPVYQGRTLYTPVYAQKDFLADYSWRPRRGLGQFEFLSVASDVVANVGSFLADVVATVAQTVASIVETIVNFVVGVVEKVVTAVLSASSGLLGAVLDAVGLKQNSSVNQQQAQQLATYLAAKHATLTGHETGLDRPMTGEEQSGYQRLLAQAQQGIQNLAGVASSIVDAVGGPVGLAVILGGAALLMSD